MITDAINEGVGHGGIVVNMSGGNAQSGVVIDPWNIDRETMTILQPDQYGTTAALGGSTSGKKMGRIKNIKATGTAQLPTVDTGGGGAETAAAQPLIEGQTFVDPISGFTFWISKATQVYQSGQFWKQDIECEQKLTPGLT